MTRSAGEKQGLEDREKRRVVSSKWAEATGNVEETFEDDAGTARSVASGLRREKTARCRRTGLLEAVR